MNGSVLWNLSDATTIEIAITESEVTTQSLLAAGVNASSAAERSDVDLPGLCSGFANFVDGTVKDIILSTISAMRHYVSRSLLKDTRALQSSALQHLDKNRSVRACHGCFIPFLTLIMISELFVSV